MRGGTHARGNRGISKACGSGICSGIRNAVRSGIGTADAACGTQNLAKKHSAWDSESGTRLPWRNLYSLFQPDKVWQLFGLSYINPPRKCSNRQKVQKYLFQGRNNEISKRKKPKLYRMALFRLNAKEQMCDCFGGNELEKECQMCDFSWERCSFARLVYDWCKLVYFGWKRKGNW